MSGQTLVLGVGNILWADEGFGVRCVEAFDQAYATDSTVTVLDGGTRGLALLEPIAAADRLILLDAVAFGGTPGEFAVVHDDEVPRFIGQRAMSLHQTGMQEVLSLAGLLDRLPGRLLLIGVEPVVLEDYGGGLSPAVSRRLDAAVRLAVTHLVDWGHVVRTRGAPLAEADVNDRALQRDPYEEGRPPAAAACRLGDARFLKEVV